MIKTYRSIRRLLSFIYDLEIKKIRNNPKLRSIRRNIIIGE
ncbi:hypothetical protein D1BOALGB6SA_9389 [Olavius sp. associated proteobacterium Delta 1]|nr:hypothetical protein D1BOALGB6SA_9389 [Olavius sp. associated proteobacterium Delta 1]